MNRSQRARRRERRIQTRLASRHERLERCLDFNHVFSLESLTDAEHRSRQGVIWKHSVSNFDDHRLMNCALLMERLEIGRYHKTRSKRFTISERGKQRHISAVAFRDRVVQRALCDQSLVPVLSSTLIHDNGASLKGKGTGFARKRFLQRARKACRRWDRPYILLFDYHDYFAGIDSLQAFDMVATRYRSLCTNDTERENVERILTVLRVFACDEKGLGLGNQTSQTLAIWYPNQLDHEMQRHGYYGRYMDDGYCICENRIQAVRAYMTLRDMSTMLGLTLNERKTRLLPLKGPWIRFLKRDHRFNDDGTVIRPARKAWKRSLRHMSHVLRGYDGILINPGTLKSMHQNMIHQTIGLTGRRRLIAEWERRFTRECARHGVNLPMHAEPVQARRKHAKRNRNSTPKPIPSPLISTYWLGESAPRTMPRRRVKG